MSQGISTRRQSGGRGWWILLALAAFIALRIAFWGQPVPTRYSARRSGPDMPQQWLIERRMGSSTESWRARDTDGDGVLDEFLAPAGEFARPGLRSEPKRWLVICLDGVPLNVMQSLWGRGHFREFYRPTAVISTLPSDSEAALTDALHAALPPGYEHRYFDRARNQVRGGAWITLTGASIPYLRALDYDAPGWAKAVVYVVSRKGYRADLGRLRNRFLSSGKKVFVAHVPSSDSLHHVFSAAEVEPLLVEFESLVRDLYLNARGELGVLVFSDHGNTLIPSRAAPLAEFLTRHGWRLGNRIGGPRDVVVPSYGLVGFLAAYCRDDATPQLAGDLAQLEGADVVVYTDPAGHAATILSASGRARLSWNADGSRFRYDAQPATSAALNASATGDPLELAAVFERLRAAGRLAKDGSATDANLFAATSTARYPDAAARIRSWATNHVQNRASVLVSLKPGYFHGAGIFQHIVRITSTHGALDGPSSFGFAMATHSLPPVVRLADLLPRGLLAKSDETTDKH